MKHILRLSLIALLSVFILQPASFAQDSDSALANSLLWKIEKKGYKDSYLFGTIHLLSEERFFMTEKVKKAFAASDRLMLELDITDSQQMVDMMTLAVMADGITMADLLEPDQYAKLDTAIMMEEGMGLVVYGNFKPFVLESILLVNLIEGIPASYEMELAKMAQNEGMSIMQLENIGQQMAIFDEIPYEEQAKDLMRYVDGKDDLKAEFDALVGMYLKEDVTGLYNMMAEYYTDDIWLEKLLVERNAKWIPKIEKATKKANMFIAVGAGHLGGDTGVIKLLKKAGYKVTPLFE